MPSTPEDRLFGITTSVAVKPAVAISADTNITLFGEQTITTTTTTGTHTVTTANGMRILVMGQANAVDNGIWIAGPATWRRAADFDGARDAINGTIVYTVYGEQWLVKGGKDAGEIRIGYDELSFYPVNIPDLTLRSTLSTIGSGEGADFLPLLQGGTVQDAINYVTPEMFGAGPDKTPTVNTAAIIQAINTASVMNIGAVRLGPKLPITDTIINVPSNVCIFGGGPKTGVSLLTAPTSPKHEVFSVAGSGVKFSDFAIDINTNGLGAIDNIRAYGVFFKSTSSNNIADKLVINGKPTSNPMGFSIGIYDEGKNNKIINNNVEYCTVGIASTNAESLEISHNYCNNHFVDSITSPWTAVSPCWDGIICEGIKKGTITYNRCVRNGQSGIYIGGNGHLSSDVLIHGNIVEENFNRGIDCGVSGGISAANAVKDIIITGNTFINNCQPQIWLFDVTKAKVLGNTVKMTADYDTVFAGFYGDSRAGISVGGTGVTGIYVDDNTASVTTTALYAVVMNGKGCYYGYNDVSGQISYIWGFDHDRLIENIVDNYDGVFTPAITEGAGVSISSGTGKYRIAGKKLIFQIDLTLSSSSSSGSLSIGYIPGMSGLTADDIQTSNINVATYNGWTGLTGVLRAYQNSNVTDQIVVYQQVGGNRVFDAATHVSNGATISIVGEITVV
ncbi:right-handed parallel beta-helix repeat-containing protein [Symbiopectobacterium sp. Eva_TO]